MNQKFTFSQQNLNGLIFLVPPILTLFLGKLLFELFAFNFSELNQAIVQNISQLSQDSTIDITFKEMKARLLWVSSVIVYFFVCSGFIVFIWHMITRHLTPKKRLLYFALAAIFLTLEIGYILFFADSENSPLLAIFRFTYNTLAASNIYTLQELTHIETTLTIINFIAIIVTPLGILTGCCIMQQNPGPSIPELLHLSSQAKHLKDLILGGSAVMVIGLIHMKLWLSWPLSFISDPGLLDQLEVISVTISQYWGITYSLIIAAMYLPAAFYLSEKARNVISHSNNDALKNNPEQWLVQNKMLISPTAQLPQLVTILSPMLVGSFGSALSSLVQF